MKLTDDDIKSIQTLGHYFARVPKEQIAALINRIFKSIDENHGIITEDTHSDIREVGISATTIIRNHYTAEYGFVYLYEKFVDALADYLRGKKVLSVMSGPCTLECHLKLRGVDIISTDSGEWYCIPKYCAWLSDSLSVEMVDAVTAVHQYGNDVDYVLCSWPPYNEGSAYDTIVAMRETNPNLTMIYIGEDMGGCCADNDFFLTVSDDIVDEKIEHLQDLFKQFWAIHDEIRFFK